MEFEEVAHSGGKISFTVVAHPETGERAVQFSWTSSRTVPAILVALWALHPGVAVEGLSIRGMGAPWDLPRIPGSIAVLIGSDSEGKFGHLCPFCDGYWRSGPHPRTCPYCSSQAEWFQFLSKAQQLYVHHYCTRWADASNAEIGASIVIDMDEIADSTAKGTPRPEFYVSEERQQTRLSCEACGEFNDIMGRFGYCSVCGTRNDFDVFAKEIMPAIRSRLDGGHPPDGGLRDAVSALDTLLTQYAFHLTSNVPMLSPRKHILERRSFLSLTEEAEAYQTWFGIDLRGNLREAEWKTLLNGILRRHLYEHNGGVVDQKYISRSGEEHLRLGQSIKESRESVHQFLTLATSVAKHMHEGFHAIFPPYSAAIEAHKARHKRSK